MSNGAVPEESQRNPFLAFLQEAGRRVLNVPGNAIRLPSQIIGSLRGRDGQAISAVNTRDDLFERVTGEQVTPFSPGRAALESLTLGLVPSGNKSNEINPNALSPEQQQRFNELNPLQQALLQAKRPQDFARLIMRDDFFAERPPPSPDEYENIPAYGAALNKRTGEAFVNYPPTTLKPEDTRLGADGVPIYQAPPAAQGNTKLSQGDLLLGPQGETIGHNPKPVVVGSEADLVVPTPGATGLVHRNEKVVPALDPQKVEQIRFNQKDKQVGNESSLRKDVASSLKEAVLAGRKWQSVIQAAAFNEGDLQKNPLDPGVLEQINKTLPTLGGRVKMVKNAAIPDIVLVFSLIQAIEPSGIVREGEQNMTAQAREFFGDSFGAEIMANLLQGEKLTNDQRARLLETSYDLFEGRLAGYEDSLREYRHTAIRSWPAISDPKSAAIDELREIRSVLAQKMGGINPKDAPLLPPNEETAELVEARFQAEHGREFKDADEAVSFLRKMGFRAPLSYQNP